MFGTSLEAIFYCLNHHYAGMQILSNAEKGLSNAEKVAEKGPAEKGPDLNF